MEKRELGMEELEQATGGVLRTVNTGVDGLKAALRSGPGKNYDQIGNAENGTLVDTVTDKSVFDPESGRNYVEVILKGKHYWIASSIVGLPR